MTLKDLEKLFLEAKEKGLDVAIEVTVVGQEDTELIINRNASIDNKLAYYKEMYNEDLTHKNDKNVKIIGISIMEYF